MHPKAGKLLHYKDCLLKKVTHIYSEVVPQGYPCEHPEAVWIAVRCMQHDRWLKQ